LITGFTPELQRCSELEHPVDTTLGFVCIMGLVWIRNGRPRYHLLIGLHVKMISRYQN